MSFGGGGGGGWDTDVGGWGTGGGGGWGGGIGGGGWGTGGGGGGGWDNGGGGYGGDVYYSNHYHPHFGYGLGLYGGLGYPFFGHRYPYHGYGYHGAPYLGNAYISTGGPARANIVPVADHSRKISAVGSPNEVPLEKYPQKKKCCSFCNCNPGWTIFVVIVIILVIVLILTLTLSSVMTKNSGKISSTTRPSGKWD